MKPLELLRSELDKCVRCGTCKAGCPVFKATNREPGCARGKLSLIDAYLKGSLELNDTLIKHIKECTLCGACKTNCPNGVDTLSIYGAARAEIVEKQGLGFAASIILKNVLDSGKVMPWAMKWATRLQSVIFKDSSAETGLLSRFSLPLVGGGRLVPPLAKTFFLELPEVKGLFAPAQEGTRQVAFYAGCGINYLLPDVGLASIDVLKRAGVGITIPAGQVCCGMPAYSMGDVKSAKTMAIKNLEVFESIEADFITTSCATCGYALKKLFRELLSEDPAYKDRVEAFSKRVRDITELLVNELGFKGGGEKNAEPVTVTYHDPCHLGRAQGVREEPRILMAASHNVKLKEMKNPCACCGLGGGLSFTNYELSMEITKRKAESVKKSGADIVATACPGCMVQLRDGLHRLGVDARVAHVVELL